MARQFINLLNLSILYGQVQLLVHKGMYVNATNNEGYTRLHLAVIQDNIDLAQELIDTGAYVNANVGCDVINREHQNNTPLHFASIKGNTLMAQLLIKSGAAVDQRNWKEETALHLASQNGNIEVFHVLIKRGADLNSKDNYGNTSLHKAVRKCQMKKNTILLV